MVWVLAVVTDLLQVLHDIGVQDVRAREETSYEVKQPPAKGTA